MPPLPFSPVGFSAQTERVLASDRSGNEPSPKLNPAGTAADVFSGV